MIDCMLVSTHASVLFDVLTIVCALLDDICTIILGYKFANQNANHVTSVSMISFFICIYMNRQ